LFDEGIDEIAQKVGEEAVETVIEAKNTDDNRFINEASDLVYHLIVLLQQRDISLQDIVENLEKRHQE